MDKNIANTEIKKWYLIDVSDKVLGRVSVEIANHLMGKSKINFERNKDIGDFVVVINATKVKVTGRKQQNKIYYHHTGYPNGLRSESFNDLLKKNPQKIIISAVKGMLPKNKLEEKMLKRLYVFPDEKHSFENKFKNK